RLDSFLNLETFPLPFVHFLLDKLSQERAFPYFVSYLYNDSQGLHYYIARHLHNHLPLRQIHNSLRFSNILYYALIHVLFYQNLKSNIGVIQSRAFALINIRTFLHQHLRLEFSIDLYGTYYRIEFLALKSIHNLKYDQYPSLTLFLNFLENLLGFAGVDDTLNLNL